MSEIDLELSAIIPPKIKHVANGFCPKCYQIIERYPGFNLKLRTWFFATQKKLPEFHLSCAGRGELDQEAAVRRGASRAHWGKSAHNYNCALDAFEIMGNTQNLYEKPWFEKVLAPEIPDWIEWYGKIGSSFYELPHLEVKGWRAMAKAGQLKLVE